MRDLFIYHPGTGTCISLTDPVYLLDTSAMTDRDIEALDDGTLSKFDAYAIGIRIDTDNMTKTFYPEGVRNA